MIIYVNGKFVPKEKAVLSVFDHGFLYGDGVYETLRAYKGEPFLFGEHFIRLKRSADGTGLRLPVSESELLQATRKALALNDLAEGVVRITITRGSGPVGFDPEPCRDPNLVIIPMPFNPYPKSFFSKGLSLGVVSVRRNSPASLPPWIKSTSCLNGIFAKVESKKLGADEGFMLSLKGHLAEGTVSNLFTVKNKTLNTPALNGELLSGVTRLHVIRLAYAMGYAVHERTMKMTDLISADEIFLTNTTMEVMPVGKLIFSKTWRRSLRTLPVGPVTKHLRRCFFLEDASATRIHAKRYPRASLKKSVATIAR